MIALKATTADDAWRQAAQLLQGEAHIQTGRDQPTRELIHVAFTLADPRQRLVFTRPINPAFAVAEVIWMLSGANASEFLNFWNPGMRRYVDTDGRVFHGAYGHRLGSNPRLSATAELALRVTNDEGQARDQLCMAYEALRHSPDSRQVVLQIWDSKCDLPNPSPRSANVPCNLLSHLMIREDRLEWLQVMRSNDLIWGTPYNLVQFTCLQEIVAGWLGVDVGGYVHVSDSLHVYQRHWEELDALTLGEAPKIPTNFADLRIEGYEAWEQVWGQVADAAVQLAKQLVPEEAFTIVDQANDLPAAYAEWIALLAAESLRRSGYDSEAATLVDRAGGYWAANWRQWFVRRRGTTETPGR